MSSCPSSRSPATERAAFSGWRIVGVAAVALAMTAPGQTVGVSVFVDPMIDALGLSRSQVSGPTWSARSPVRSRYRWWVAGSTATACGS